MKLHSCKILTFLLTLVLYTSYAQEKNISGTIKDSNGLPLVGAAIIVKGTSKGTTSDFDGNYAIKATVGQILYYSFIGYKSKEVPVKLNTEINITLQENTSSLDEVVVVAYGTQKKEALVGSVSSIDASVISSQQVTSPLRALQGTVPGVNLITQGGQPGEDSEIRIRGFGSLNSDRGPLILLDGVEFNANINTISQDQIENISVLKDAGSAALYGSRAANGVIAITTKTGKLNTALKATVRTQFGVSSPSVGIQPTLGAEDHIRSSWQALRNTNQFVNGQSAAEAGANASSGLIAYLGGYNPYDVANPIDENGNLVAGANLLWDTDWEDVIFNDNANRINHNLSLTGGSKTTSYFFSLDYLDEEGPVINSDFERISTRLNIESQINSWLKFGAKTSFSRSNSSNPDQTSNSSTQAISWVYNVASVYPIFARDSNGSLILDDNGELIFDLGNGNGRPVGQANNATRPFSSGDNILASLLLERQREVRTNYIGNAFLEIDLYKGLSFKSSFAYESFKFDSSNFQDVSLAAASEVGGRVSETINSITTLNAIQALTYETSFAKKHNIKAEAILEAFTETSGFISVSATGLLPGLDNLNAATNPESASGNETSQRLNGYFGRLSYNYDNKYFAEVSGRRDGSSRFNDGNRQGNFYALGGSWIISKEKFMTSFTAIDYLKLRASYGLLGNNRIGADGDNFFPTQSVFRSGFSNESVSGVILEGISDPNLVWESTRTSDIGLDFGLFGGRLSGTFDYYSRRSEELINNVPSAPSSGALSLLTNNGELRNYGFEFAVNAQIFNTKDFEWDFGLNFSTNNNEITELPQDRIINGNNLLEEGNSIFDFFLREWAGVDSETGFGTWYIHEFDDDGNVIGRTTTFNFSEATNFDTGKSSLPDIQGGFSSFFKYKCFDLNLLFNYSLGSYIFNTDYAQLLNTFRFAGSSAHPDNLNAWQQPGDTSDVPLLLASNNSNGSASTRFLEKNDWLRLRALTFGYNLPSGTIDGISKLRLFFQADNLFTWATLDDTEPEQAFNGTTNNRSPLSKTLSGGLIIEF